MLVTISHLIDLAGEITDIPAPIKKKGNRRTTAWAREIMENSCLGPLTADPDIDAVVRALVEDDLE